MMIRLEVGKASEENGVMAKMLKYGGESLIRVDAFDVI